jgi:RNA polymerase sigma-70 factor (ECF subfamily)
LEDSQLIARVLNGDRAAEREMYDTNVDRVFRLAYRMTGDEMMAEDYTQETFIRAFDRLESFQGRSALSTWIYSIAVSVVLSGLRKVKRLRNREAELDDVTARAASVGSADVEMKIRLHQAIDGLPDDLRITFVMYDVEGYKHHEIAEIFGVPVGTIKSRLSRARQALRHELAGGKRRPAEEDWR